MSNSLFLLTALLLAAAAAAISTKTVESLTVAPGCPASCGGVDIPYPFGIGSGCFRKGFEIECMNNGPVLAGTTLGVVYLSVDPAESQVMLPVAWQCYNASSPGEAEDYSNGETYMNKDGVYRISNRHNMLVVLGCNTFAFTASARADGGSAAYIKGCMSYCNNSASAEDGMCAGAGCCHVDIPPGLTESYFRFWAYDHSAMMDYSPCDYAFIVDRANYTFRRSDLLMDRNRTSPVRLDWAIRDNDDTVPESAVLSCAGAARSTTTEYACVSDHSECVDSLNGPGYSCSCSDGYEGNPYVVNGCASCWPSSSMPPSTVRPRWTTKTI
ncbi:hypothetical protein QYE76_009032 [Lolium multiflorum]|uniref:Wall-associated receptor kinase galacturonan-binding domain-containing protein n=1 Tax=Lolium multiflorum TaxID=4521 RepID=A0AAD8TR67_LOLMU|nr:hypothetical protein QYE76_009032 [Lolium multiflorum]